MKDRQEFAREKGAKVFQDEGPVSAKALGQEGVWPVQTAETESEQLWPRDPRPERPTGAPSFWVFQTML